MGRALQSLRSGDNPELIDVYVYAAVAVEQVMGIADRIASRRPELAAQASAISELYAGPGYAAQRADPGLQLLQRRVRAFRPRGASRLAPSRGGVNRAAAW